MMVEITDWAKHVHVLTESKSLTNSFLMTLSIWKNNPFQSVVVVVDASAAADNSDNIL